MTTGKKNLNINHLILRGVIYEKRREEKRREEKRREFQTKLVSIMLAFGLLLFFGCGNDDDDGEETLTGAVTVPKPSELPELPGGNTLVATEAEAQALLSASSL
ncbi:MAG: hypothetical protein LBQ88_05220 [Treponema sp.]|nr:hypothetical protein [Treponema sp.]